MKKSLCILTMTSSVLLGVLHVSDLLLRVDPATGFITQGSMELRYALMLLPVLLALFTGLAIDKKRFFAGIGSALSMALLPLTLASEVYGVLTILTVVFNAGEPSSSHHITKLRVFLENAGNIVCAVLFILFGVWCLLLFLAQRSGRVKYKGMLYLGVAGSAAFYLHTVMRFVGQPASWQRLQPLVEILAALSALLFITSFLRATYLPQRTGGVRSVCRNGLLAFLFCTCLAVPQALWQTLTGAASPVAMPLALVLGFTGLLGAVAAAETIWSD